MEIIYERTNWLDHFIDEDGKVVQQGTPVNASNLNNIENCIVLLVGNTTFTEDELDAMLSEVLV